MKELHIDLHVHTSHSYDSLQSPHTVASYAQRAGLDAIAITDHNTYDAHQHIETTENLTIIPGMEIRTQAYDDLLALFISEPITSTSFRAAVAEIHNQGGIAVLPHPYRKVASYPDSLLTAVDAFEGLNARSKTHQNEAARELDADWDGVMTGGSDAHTPWEIGTAYSVVSDATPDSLADIKDAILDGRVQPVGTESPYYFYHGLSVAVEQYKTLRDNW